LIIFTLKYLDIVGLGFGRFYILRELINIGKRWKHWCPCGCGKSVFWNGKVWFCDRCNSIIEKIDLLSINNKSGKWKGFKNL